jgi:hypothetical protein
MLVILAQKTLLHALEDGAEAATAIVVAEEAEIATSRIATSSHRLSLYLKNLRLMSQTHGLSRLNPTIVAAVVADAINVAIVDQNDQMAQIIRKRTSGHSRSSEKRMKRLNSSFPSFSITSWARWAS